jgi:hypothetical protein
MKSLYRHKTSGDVFAIETDERGCIVSSCGPLLSDKLDPRALDYDDYPLGTGWNMEISEKMGEFEKIRVGTAHPTSRDDFERISKDDYLELLRRNGFFPQITQRHLF